MESQVNVKVFQPLHHKGGDYINKMLNINSNGDNVFSFDEYYNAIIKERATRQTILKLNNDEMQNRRELKRIKNINNPKLFEKNQQIRNQVMIERMKQTVSKNIRKNHNEINEEQNNDDEQIKRELMQLKKLNHPSLQETSQQQINQVMIERMKQTVFKTTRKNQNEIFEANNDELLNKPESMRLTKLNDPSLVEKSQQLSKQVMTERMKQTFFKNARKNHNTIFEANNDDAQTKRERMRLDKINDPSLVETSQHLSKQVMIERMKQTVSKNIRSGYNNVYENIQNDYYNGNVANDDNWNINNITFETSETSEDKSYLARVVIRKRRGNKQNEEIVPIL